MRQRLVAVSAALALVAGALACGPSARADDHAAGRDVSFPQCGNELPNTHDARFGVLGATGGRAFTTNPCLVSQLRWAKRLSQPPAFYANTGNPGPARSAHWPLGQTSPRVCTNAAPNSLGCSYDYGWNAAMHAFTVATDAAQRLHRVSRLNARSRVANVDWWLDVEILNSWQTLDGASNVITRSLDTATIAGEVNALWSLGVARVGIYSTPFQWRLITGGPAITQASFRANPVWLAGFDGHDDAQAACGRTSFTGGSVQLAQYLGADGFDADISCPS